MTAALPMGAVTPPTPRAFWTRALAALALVVAVVLAFLPTSTEIAGIWWRSGTFAHGLVVLPISAWLLWGMRHEFAATPWRPALLPVLGVGSGGLAWLVGEAGGVAALSHFALAVMIAAGLWSVWGHALSARAWFPIVFIFFGVPFGEFLVPSLMDHTADFTVAALRLSGVPVFREGNNFVIPSGHWSVVEACSGIRYLIASVMVGTLYAWLTYRRRTRRLLFVAASIIVPLVANWLRAYLIVMLGHLSSNRIATGVDHLVYGWVFFGVVILALFWIGARWREDDSPVSTGASPVVVAEAPGVHWAVLAVALALAALPWPVLATRMLDRAPPGPLAIALPEAQGGWRQAGETSWRPGYVGMRAERAGRYQRDGQEVGLYLAYYAAQGAGTELVQWDNQIVRSTMHDRVELGRRAMPLPAAGAAPGQAVRVRDADGEWVVWYQYWLGSVRTAQPWRAKLELAIDRLSGRPDGSALILLRTAGQDDAETRARLDAFLSAHLAGIESALARTANPR